MGRRSRRLTVLMGEYQPASRRPIASVFRATAAFATKTCVRARIHPDAISYSSIAAALAAAICFLNAADHPFLLLVAPAFCLLRLYLNMLDGMVAIAAGKASVRGEIVNDLPDRISDVVIFAGAAHSGYMFPVFGYWAAIFSLLTAYVGLFGQAIVGRREFSGWMSKPWRMVMLSAGACVTFGCVVLHRSCFFGPLAALDWTCVFIIAGCVQTMGVRLKRILATVHDAPR